MIEEQEEEEGVHLSSFKEEEEGEGQTDIWISESTPGQQQPEFTTTTATTTTIVEIHHDTTFECDYDASVDCSSRRNNTASPTVPQSLKDKELDLLKRERKLASDRQKFEQEKHHFNQRLERWEVLDRFRTRARERIQAQQAELKKKEDNLKAREMKVQSRDLVFVIPVTGQPPRHKIIFFLDNHNS